MCHRIPTVADHDHTESFLSDQSTGTDSEGLKTY